MKDHVRLAADALYARRLTFGSFDVRLVADGMAEALDAANLLATPEMRETMKCLSPKAAAAVSMSGGLVGVRLGIESDFVTPAMRQAVEACKAFEQAPAIANGAPYLYDVRAAGRAIIAEEAERAPKPRWEAWPISTAHDETEWVVKVPGTTKRSGYWTESQARAVAKALNEEGGGRG